MRLERSIVSGNADIDVSVLSGGYVTSYTTHNLFGDRSKTTAEALNGIRPDPSDITATSDGTQPAERDGILDTVLRNNGGPTKTHVLVHGSPAIDAALGCPPPEADQRGTVRPQGVACDIGAYEVAEACETADLAIRKSVRPARGQVGAALTYTLNISNQGPYEARAVRIVDRFDGPVAVVALPDGCGTNRTGALACRLGTLAPGHSVSLEIGVTPDQAGRLTNIARVRSPTADPNRRNTRDHLVVHVGP